MLAIGGHAAPQETSGIKRKSSMGILSIFTKTISRKITSGFAVVLCLLLAVVLTTLVQMGKQETINQRIVLVRSPTALLDQTLLAQIYTTSSAYRGYMLTKDQEFLTQQEDTWTKKVLPTLAKLEELSKSWTNPENKVRLATVEKMAPEIRDLQNQATRLCVKDPKAAALIVTAKLHPANAVISEALNALAADQAELAVKDGQEALQVGANLRLLLIALLVIALALGMAISWVTTRSIVKPIDRKSTRL